MAAPTTTITTTTPLLDKPFLAHLAEIHNPANAQSQEQPRLRWYLTAAIALGGMNYPEEIPALYAAVLEDYVESDDEQKQKEATGKLREGLTKACGIWGAAKVFCPFCFYSSSSYCLFQY